MVRIPSLRARQLGVGAPCLTAMVGLLLLLGTAACTTPPEASLAEDSAPEQSTRAGSTDMELIEDGDIEDTKDTDEGDIEDTKDIEDNESDLMANGPMVARRVEDNPGVSDENQHWIGRNLMTDTSIELVWSTVDGENGPPRYRIYRVERNASAFDEYQHNETLMTMALTDNLLVYDSVAEDSATTWTDEQVEAGTFYSYVLSVDVDELTLDRRWTSTVALTDTEPPSPITGLQAQLAEASNETGVFLSWDQSSDNGAFASYAVSLVSETGELQYLGGGNQDFQVTFLDTRPPVGVVTYAVQAVDFHDNRTEPAMITIDTTLAPQVSAGSIREGRVQYVLDGDSFDMNFEAGAFGDDPDVFPSRRSVRLVGINAPEENECFAEESRSLVQGLTNRRLSVQGDDVDGFGRLLAFVWELGDGQVVPADSSTGPNISGTINEWLVLEGAALARSSFGHEWDDAFDAAEVLAKEQEVGMWSPDTCGSDAVARISQVWFDAPGRDDENPNGEWIRIVNSGEDELDLTGWVVRDESTRHRFIFPDGTSLGPGAALQVFSGCDASSSDPAPTEAADELGLFWCAPDGPVWSNSGDTALLLDAFGRTVDTETWESIYDDE